MNPDELRRRIEELGTWFHNIELAPGVWTNRAQGDYPSRRWQAIAAHIPDDLTGKSVLDLSCNSGFFSARMKRRGAARVVGVEGSRRYIRQAQLVREALAVDIELVHANVSSYMWNLQDEFDYIIFVGLFYHLRAPLLVLDRAALSVRERLFFQSERYPFDVLPDEELPENVTVETMRQPGYPKAHFVERRFSGDRTNWWLPNRACIEACLRSSGLTRFFRAEEEIYVCDAPPDRTAVPRYDVTWEG